MKKVITGAEYGRLPVFAHSLYEYKGIDNYVLVDTVNHDNFIAMMYYHSKELSFVEFNIWFKQYSPIRICDNLEIKLLSS